LNDSPPNYIGVGRTEPLAERLARMKPGVDLPCPPLAVPIYDPPPNAAYRRDVFLALESFRRHMTDEGWQLQIGLQKSGYELWGPGFADHRNNSSVPSILSQAAPNVVIVQDKREWDRESPACFDSSAHFEHVGELSNRPDIFKVTIAKDVHQRPDYSIDSYNQIAAHAWVIYYHPVIVQHLAPWLRPEHCIRTYHSLEPSDVPVYRASGRSNTALLSGAFNPTYYPLRARLSRNARKIEEIELLKHPGYHAGGSATPAFLQILSGFKVAICTSSKLAYALRKIAEATACGCVVVTDLPFEEHMPGIDGNLLRVPQAATVDEVRDAVRLALAGYDPARQQEFAEIACDWYDWRKRGGEVAKKIEALRRGYNATI